MFVCTKWKNTLSKDWLTDFISIFKKYPIIQSQSYHESYFKNLAFSLPCISRQKRRKIKLFDSNSVMTPIVYYNLTTWWSRFQSYSSIFFWIFLPFSLSADTTTSTKAHLRHTLNPKQHYSCVLLFCVTIGGRFTNTFWGMNSLKPLWKKQNMFCTDADEHEEHDSTDLWDESIQQPPLCPAKRRKKKDTVPILSHHQCQTPLFFSQRRCRHKTQVIDHQPKLKTTMTVSTW